MENNINTVSYSAELVIINTKALKALQAAINNASSFDNVKQLCVAIEAARTYDISNLHSKF